MNSLYIISNVLSIFLNIQQNTDLDSVFSGPVAAELGVEGALNAKMRVLTLFDGALGEVSFLTISSQRVTTMLNNIKEAQGRFLAACGRGNTHEFHAVMDIRRSFDLLSSHGDTVDSTGNFHDSPLNRRTFLDDTQMLIDTIGKSALPHPQKSILLLKLKAVNRIVSECQFMSDDQIRHRIKCIVADFLVEFNQTDQQYEEMQETLIRWATSFIPHGIVALALTNDVVQIAGLLAAP